MPHLFSGLIAVALGAAVLFTGQIVAIHLEHTTVTSTAPELFPLKNQGLAFQRAAARTPNVLPFYGTSELLIPAIPEKGDNFFRTAPTGFQVSPVGTSAREDYYRKLRALVKQYHFPLLEFEAYDEDSAFLIRHQSPFTAKGWMYYDRARDDFFHGRMPRS